MNEAIAVFNAGSTSLKFGIYVVQSKAALLLLFAGRVDGLQSSPRFTVRDSAGNQVSAHGWGAGQSIGHAAAMRHVIGWLEANLPGTEIIAAGHRVKRSGQALKGALNDACPDLSFAPSALIKAKSDCRYPTEQPPC